ncbi:MAG: O-phosphoserine--tRNA ligase [Candidatus Hadarchaeales archaeon]
MKFDVGRIKRMAEEDYERAWLETSEIIERKGKFLKLGNKRKPHPLFDLISKIREVMLGLGFSEVVVPTIIERGEVFLQYGPEAPVILDRVFFLAGLDRPDIGLSKRRIEQIQSLIPGFEDFDRLQDILRRYKLGKVGADELVEVMVRELELREEQATSLLSLFEEFKQLKPIPTNLTLRSHLTAGWFAVLREMQRREPLPIQLFSIGPKFRREQKLDEAHLYDSWTASLVVMAERMSLEDGQELVRRILRELGFEDVKLELKAATSKYYAPRTEFEVFLRHPRTGGFLEVGDAGFYSPVSLSKYDISYPVFNFGMGLERLLMVMTGETDIRALVYPYLYTKVAFSDADIASMLKLEKGPKTEVGRRIAEAIVRVAEEHADEPSPCEFKAFEGELLGKRVSVSVVEPESGTKLIGPAGFNVLYVYDGNIIGLPPKGWEEDEFLRKVKEQGTSTGIRYIDAFAALAAHEIERAVERGEREVRIRVRAARLLSDINLTLEEAAQRYVTDNRKKIDVRGPIFTTVVARIG